MMWCRMVLAPRDLRRSLHGSSSYFITLLLRLLVNFTFLAGQLVDIFFWQMTGKLLAHITFGKKKLDTQNVDVPPSILDNILQKQLLMLYFFKRLSAILLNVRAPDRVLYWFCTHARSARNRSDQLLCTMQYACSARNRSELDCICALRNMRVAPEIDLNCVCALCNMHVAPQINLNCVCALWNMHIAPEIDLNCVCALCNMHVAPETDLNYVCALCNMHVAPEIDLNYVCALCNMHIAPDSTLCT